MGSGGGGRGSAASSAVVLVWLGLVWAGLVWLVLAWFRLAPSRENAKASWCPAQHAPRTANPPVESWPPRFESAIQLIFSSPSLPAIDFERREWPLQDGNCPPAAGHRGAEGPARRVSPAGYAAPKVQEGREQQDRGCLGEIETVVVLAASVFLARVHSRFRRNTHAPTHPRLFPRSAKTGRPPSPATGCQVGTWMRPEGKGPRGAESRSGVSWESKQKKTSRNHGFFAPFIPCHAHPSADISAPPLANWGPRNRPTLAIVSSEHPDLCVVCVCVCVCAGPGHWH